MPWRLPPASTKATCAGQSEAAHLAQELDFGLVVPTHYDLFAFNTVDPGYFTSYQYRLNHERKHKILRPGELLHFVREST